MDKRRRFRVPRSLLFCLPALVLVVPLSGCSNESKDDSNLIEPPQNPMGLTPEQAINANPTTPNVPTDSDSKSSPALEATTTPTTTDNATIDATSSHPAAEETSETPKTNHDEATDAAPSDDHEPATKADETSKPDESR